MVRGRRREWEIQKKPLKSNRISDNEVFAPLRVPSSGHWLPKGCWHRQSGDCRAMLCC